MTLHETASSLDGVLQWSVLPSEPRGTMVFTQMKGRSLRNPCDEKLVFAFDFGFGCAVPDHQMLLRDMFAFEDVDGVEYSVPHDDMCDARIFETFQPITKTDCSPPWAKFFFRYRNPQPVLVPKSLAETWMEGRWAARVNTNTFPVTISAWFECEEDVALIRLAGLPLSEKFVAISGKAPNSP